MENIYFYELKNWEKWASTCHKEVMALSNDNLIINIKCVNMSKEQIKEILENGNLHININK